MSEQKKTLKEKRIESDARIIASAIKTFAENGYTHSSIRDIAKGAGVTSGLITQRFSTKENLFITAYEETLKDAFRKMDANATPRECLYAMIEDIEKLSETAPEKFNFFYMLYTSCDYPREVLVPIARRQKSSNSYKILEEAQKNGMIPGENLDVTMAAFAAMLFQNIGLTKKYGLEHEKKDKLLEWIRFSDSVTKDRDNWFRVLQKAIENTFDALVYVNIANNCAEMIECDGTFSTLLNTTDVREYLRLLIESDAPEAEKKKIEEYLNIDTLSDRLKGRKSISYRPLMLGGKCYTHTFIPVSWDEEGKLIEVFAGMYHGTNG